MSVLEKWHAIVQSGDAEELAAIIADDCVFYSPVVHSPQRGKDITLMYLTAAMHVLVGDTFEYVREVSSGNNAVLEFTTENEGIFINGVDMIQWNDDGRITEFKVMVRPLKAINLLHGQMRDMLEQLSA